ncbi:hypothetical protein SteCoe_5970 [Stentor coeruleus]|uniref:Uncharacterized protein n=1 Tax=Stentor coeruleus TaxID=5963 RepID=A0A1R2CR47_9CILI|nr:hypothetical protein SteCoe_5970 [Stentor coeruleus]
MIHLTSKKKKPVSLEKPSTLEELYNVACQAFKTDLEHMLLVLVEENLDKIFLERDVEYESACQKTTDLNVVAYIKPRQYSTFKKRLIAASSILAYLLVSVVLGLPYGIFNIFYVIFALFYEIFDMVIFFISNFGMFLYWAPYVLPLVYMIYVSYFWVTRSLEENNFSKRKIGYWIFFTSNLIPNAIGFLSTMIGILWLAIALSKVFFHKPRPLNEKDSNFIIVLCVYLATSVVRIIYFY